MEINDISKKIYNILKLEGKISDEIIVKNKLTKDEYIDFHNIYGGLIDYKGKKR